MSRGSRDAETPFRRGSIGEVCLFTHLRAQLNAARPRPSTLLTTASQARHAPRLAPMLTRMRGRGKGALHSFGLPSPSHQLLLYITEALFERIERITRRKILLHDKALATDLLCF
jgi:hypothetical protein